jgi:hypothetical protein
VAKVAPDRLARENNFFQKGENMHAYGTFDGQRVYQNEKGELFFWDGARLSVNDLIRYTAAVRVGEATGHDDLAVILAAAHAGK